MKQGKAALKRILCFAGVCALLVGSFPMYTLAELTKGTEEQISGGNGTVSGGNGTVSGGNSESGSGEPEGDGQGNSGPTPNPLTLEKAALTGSLSVNDIQAPGTYVKNQPLVLQAKVFSSVEDEVKNYYGNIDVTFSAVLVGEEESVIELGSVQGKDAGYADSAAVYTLTVGAEACNALRDGKTYQFRANVTPQGEAAQLFTGVQFVSGAITVSNSKPVIKVETKNIEYGTESTLAFSILDAQGGNTIDAGQLAVTFSSHDTDKLTIDENGTLHPHKGGLVTITVTVDDKDNTLEDKYVKVSQTADIYITPSQNTGYTVNGIEADIFWGQYVSTVVGADDKVEMWYGSPITIQPETGSCYNEIVYRVKDGEWQSAGSAWTIGASSLTDFEFYLRNVEEEISTYEEATQEEKVQGGLKTLSRLGIDMTVPRIEGVLTTTQQPSQYSTDSISYFPEAVTLTVCAEKNGETERAMDTDSGISKVLIQYGGSENWEELAAVEERYGTSYTFTLEESASYGNIKVKAVDYAGNESNVAEFGKEICIDTAHPALQAVAYAADGQEYDGSWTNQQLCYELALREDVVSGIQSLAYTFIPKGTEFDANTAVWHSISPEEMQIVLGMDTSGTEQETYEGTLLYGDELPGEEQADSGLEDYVQMDGVLYFKAESNAGLETKEQDVEASAADIRLWQQKPENARVYADKCSDEQTGWYNGNTGPVTISFGFPEKPENGPALKLTYKMEIYKTDTTTPDTTIRKSFREGEVPEDIQITEDSIVILRVYVEDEAGNRSDMGKYQIQADFTAPERLTAMADTEVLDASTDLTGPIVYRTFSGNSITIQGSAEYGISGKQAVYLMKCKNAGDWERLSDAAVDSLVMTPCDRGFFYLCAVDGAGNRTVAVTEGIVVDNMAPAAIQESDIRIELQGANGEGFFNADFTASIQVQDAPGGDGYAGLQSVQYSVGRDGTDTRSDMVLYQFRNASPTWKDIEGTAGFRVENILINAAENESNEAYLKVTATDNAGNTGVVTYPVKIDVTAPRIEVSYDYNQPVHDSFYSENRVARIQITEKNFSPEQVELLIGKDGAEPVVKALSEESWMELEKDVHVAYFSFTEDGDYAFTVRCTDLADNTAEYEKIDVFTIDKTKPVVQITYDNESAWKENYFQAPRTATITVVEHNFSEEGFAAVVSPQAAMSSWSHNGDTHTVRLYFDQDNHYLYEVHCTDLAGNEMEPLAPEEFYLDMTVPELEITGVQDRSANAGEVIPVILAADANYDLQGLQITLENSKKEQIALKPVYESREGMHSYTLEGVNGLPDEIYTLSAVCTDLAGNSSQYSIRFSLNRKGSTYDLSGINSLVEKTYIRYQDLEDLTVWETNVDTIEEFSIYLSRNGTLFTESEEGQRPDAAGEGTTYYAASVNGNEFIGYEYQYTIYRENFEQEGIYNLLFYSKDRAGNEVNNTLEEKNAEIRFVVDNTPPAVVIDGVESGQFYAEDSREVNVYVADNFKLAEATFYLLDENGKTLESYDYLALAEEGEIVTLTLPHSSRKMTLAYTVRDAAGNEIVTLQDSPEVPASFMISTNMWLRFVNNKAAMAIAFGSVGAAGAGTAGIWRFRRRRAGR